ncbi:hypothetical protein [Metabacillus fastidiosus]|uniref:hypothetical protein n=1 Tax=Metabacillus fastidiosus TaxID=1458 RepID=UPI003D2D7A9D
MELVETETIYHYKMPQLEKLVLTGVLAKIIEEGEIKVEDEKTKEILQKIFNGLRT